MIMLRRYSLQTSTYPCCLVCTCFLGGRITPGPNGLRLLSAFPPGRRDGRKRPFVRPVNRTAERRWKAAPILPPAPRRPIHNLRGLIKYSSGKIVDYAAVATIAVAVLLPRSLCRSFNGRRVVCHTHSFTQGSRRNGAA